MIELLKKSATGALAVTTGIFTFVPESVFGIHEWISQSFLDQCKQLSDLRAYEINVIISRLICFMLIWIVATVLYALFRKLRQWTTIRGENYSIRVEYGNILKVKKCKRIISFDECFTTQVGDGIADINPRSICGQYLSEHRNLDIQQLIEDAKVVPARSKSKYQQKTRYESGTIVPNGDDLLMAFAKLDNKGKGRLTRDEYLECLNLLWKELENYYSQKDVCIPILGAGTTSFDGGAGASISQQDLLDMMIWSYKLSSHKIKAPHRLRIVCKKNDGFSINNINQ